MIKHIVMWKLKDYAEGRKKEENAKIIKNEIESLRGIIPQIRHIEVGINLNKGEGLYDIVLYSVFDSMEDLESYQNNTHHVKVAEYIGKVREERIAVDYDI